MKVRIPTRDGNAFDAHLSLPPGNKGPGVVMIPEIFGVNEGIHRAADLFARQGYEATTLAQIADGVGIRKPSLYNHIDSKAALFLDLVAQVEAAFFVVQDASLARHAEADVKTRLHALVEDLSVFIFTESQGAFYKRCLLFPPEPLASAGIQATRWSLDRADHSAGRRNLLLRALDAAGLGFDS